MNARHGWRDTLAWVQRKWDIIGPWLVATLALTLLAIGGVGLVQTWAFTTDDAYITLRYARHLASGLGLVWNPGESPPIEGYSNSLILLVAAAMDLVSLNPVSACKWLGVSAWLAAVFFLIRWLAPRIGWAWASLAAGIWASSQGAIMWAVSGLETLCFCAQVLAIASWLENSERSNNRRPASMLALAGWCCLAILTRPEGLIVACVATWAAWRDDQRWNSLLSGAWLPFFAAYQGFRWLYFAAWLPNSARCKLGGLGSSITLLDDYWSAAWPLLFFVAFCGSGSVFVHRRHAAYFLGLPLIYAVMIVDVDPVIGQWQRHVLAALGLLTGCAALGFHHWQRSRLAVVQVAILGIVMALAWTRAFDLPRLASKANNYAERMQARHELATYLRNQVEPGSAIVLGDVGIAGYALAREYSIVDAFCLNNHAFPRPPIDRDPGRFADMVLQHEPAAIVVHSRSAGRLRPRPAYGVYPALVEREAFLRHYQQHQVFGRPGDAYFYWVYLRDRRADHDREVVHDLDSGDELLRSHDIDDDRDVAGDLAED